MAVGTLCGLWLLGTLSPKWPLFALGVYVMLVALRVLAPRRGEGTAHPHWGHAAAGLIGVVEVMFATAGPVVAAWLQLRRLEPQTLRATVPVVMVLAGAIAIGVMLAMNQLDLAATGLRWLAALPIAIAGVMLGNRLASRIPALWMGRILQGLLLISGLALMRHALV